MRLSTGWCVVLVCGCTLAMNPLPASAQISIEDATKISTAVAERKKAVESVLKPEATAAALAAEAASKAAVEAATAGAKADASAKDKTAMLATVQGDAAAAVKTATAAATAATAAADAAVKAEAVVAGELAKARASQAATAARRAAIAAGDAAKATDAPGKVVASAKTLDDAARKAAATVASEALKAAAQTAAAAEQTSLTATEAASPSLPVTGPRDQRLLAALRAQITGGAIFFNGAPRIVKNEAGTEATMQSQQFGQAATYLAFESQPRLWSGNVRRCTRDDATCLEKRATSIRTRGYDRIYVDPFVNVRLTTIPVAGASQEARISAPGEAFLQSQKAAQVQVGGHTGINFGKFSVGDTDFHWGFGPVAMFMFQSVTDAQRSLRVWDLDDDLYNLSSFGVRITLYEKDREVGGTVRDGWTPAAYFDVSRGDFQNFQTAVGKTDAARACLANPKSCLATGVPPETDFERQRENRYYLQGRVFLQYLYLGFDINNGPGPDDMRFIFGLTAKLDTFFARR